MKAAEEERDGGGAVTQVRVMRPVSSHSPPTLENFSVTNFCTLVPPTRKPNKTLTRVCTSRPSGSRGGKGWRPTSPAPVALRRRSPLLSVLAPAGSASSGPATSHRHAPTARATASKHLNLHCAQSAGSCCRSAGRRCDKARRAGPVLQPMGERHPTSPLLIGCAAGHEA